MPLLEVQDLKKSYVAPDGERDLIIDVPHFALGDGAQVALEGASGSGKTTFLNLIAGILQADGGRIFVAGEEMTALAESARDRLRARTIGYVFQTFNLLQAFTALENVLLAQMFGAGADASRARDLLERVGLRERMDYRPRALSTGQQQRVAIARALANRPRLVLADEPTGNLDRARAGDALALMREVCREQAAALLLVSHDPAVLENFERVEQLSHINRAAGEERGEQFVTRKLEVEEAVR